MGKYRQYDPNVDYMQRMNDAKAANDPAAFAEAQEARNAKIENMKLPYKQTHEQFNGDPVGIYSSAETGKNNGIQSGIAPGNGISGIVKRPFDPNVNYMQRMNDAKAANDPSAFTEAQKDRNAKIDGLKMPYKKTYEEFNGDPLGVYDTTGERGKEYIKPLFPQMQEKKKDGFLPYDPDADYMALINGAITNGNYALAAEYERLRNLKIGDMQLPYAATDMFNYIDRNGYGGEVDRLYNEIANYNKEGFSYDYESDPRYQQLLKQQKKDAETQYENGLAELSQQFGGDVPANLVGGLLKAQQDTIDAADDYIPQLWQLAQDMWINEGNQLYNQYNLASAKAAEDYDKWNADRDFRMQSYENEYGRNIGARDYNRSVFESDRAFNEDVRRFDVDENQWQQQFERGNYESDRAFNEDVRRFDVDANLRQQQFDYEKGIDERDFAFQQGLSNFDMMNMISDNIYRDAQTYLALGYSSKDAYAMAEARAREFYGKYYPDFTEEEETEEQEVPAITTGGTVSSAVSGGKAGSKSNKPDPVIKNKQVGVMGSDEIGAVIYKKK